MKGKQPRKKLRGPWKCSGCGRIFESNETPALGCLNTRTNVEEFWCKECHQVPEPEPDEDDEDGEEAQL